jgi:hypothetical protein
VGNPSVVSDEGTDEKGDTGAPDGTSTGFEVVVSEAGAETGSVVCAQALGTSKPVSNIIGNDVLRLEANMAGAND